MTYPADAVPVPGPDTPTWTADGNGVGLGPVRTGWRADVTCHGEGRHELAERVAAALNAARVHEGCGPAADIVAARAAYLAGDWDDLERALGIGDVPDAPSVAVIDLLVDGGTDG